MLLQAKARCLGVKQRTLKSSEGVGSCQEGVSSSRLKAKPLRLEDIAVRKHNAEAIKLQDRSKILGSSGHAKAIAKSLAKKYTIIPVFCDVNKKIADFPLARDSRRASDWKRKPDGSWTSLLPGENSIRLTTKLTSPRYPNTVDVNILFYVMTLSKLYDSNTINIKRFKQVLKFLGYSDQTYNITRIKDALEYWRLTRITYDAGYPEQRRLPVAIDSVMYPKGHRPNSVVMIEVNQKFRKFFEKRRTVRIPMPLPKGTLSQNMILLLASSYWHDYTTDDGDKIRKRPAVPMYRIARKLGITHSDRNKAITKACVEVEEFYREYKGMIYLIPVKEDGVHKINYLLWKDMDFSKEVDKPDEPVIEQPKIKKKKRKKPPQKIAAKKQTKAVVDMENWKLCRASDDIGNSCYIWINSITGETLEEDELTFKQPDILDILLKNKNN